MANMTARREELRAALGARKIRDYTLRFEGESAAICDDAVENVTHDLNEELDGEPDRYSDLQVKRALWFFLLDEIDNVLENIEERFEDKVNRLSCSERDRLLGAPEVNLREEARLERGDRLYDERSGN